MKHVYEKQCPKCQTWMKQTSGYIRRNERGNEVSIGTSWKCERCGHEEGSF